MVRARELARRIRPHRLCDLGHIPERLDAERASLKSLENTFTSNALKAGLRLEGLSGAATADRYKNVAK